MSTARGPRPPRRPAPACGDTGGWTRRRASAPARPSTSDRDRRNARTSAAAPHARRPRSEPGALDLDAATAERHLTVVVAMTNRGPFAVPLALRTDDIVDLLLHHRAQHPEPDGDAEGKQPLLRCPDQLAERFLHSLGEHGLLHGRLRDRYVATHGGSSFDLGRIARHAPTRSGRGREGPPSPQTSTRSGTTSGTTAPPTSRMIIDRLSPPTTQRGRSPATGPRRTRQQNRLPARVPRQRKSTYKR